MSRYHQDSSTDVVRQRMDFKRGPGHEYMTQCNIGKRPADKNKVICIDLLLLCSQCRTVTVQTAYCDSLMVPSSMAPAVILRSRTLEVSASCRLAHQKRQSRRMVKAVSICHPRVSACNGQMLATCGKYSLSETDL